MTSDEKPVNVFKTNIQASIEYNRMRPKER